MLSRQHVKERFIHLHLELRPHPYSTRQQFRLGKITRITAQFHQLPHDRPIAIQRERSGIRDRSEISKTGRGRIELHRIAPIRERVNLHSIKFVVIKSISAIQPAWPLHCIHQGLFRNHTSTRAHIYAVSFYRQVF